MKETSSRAKKLLQYREEIITLLEKAGARNPQVFGSVARGDDGDESDIDLLVDFDLNLGLLPIVRVNGELSILLKERVEVSPQGILLPEILASALIDAVPL